MPRSAANLIGWLNEPYIKAPVLDVLKRAEYPLLMREVAEACSIPVRAANRVLPRAVEDGQASRWKLPMKRHAYCFKTRACIPNGATRQLYVYFWLGSSEPS